VQLIDHRVDGGLQLEDLAADVDGDLARHGAAGDGGGDFGDVADLVGQVARHRVDRVGEVLPGAGGAGHDGLAAEAAFGADFLGHAGYFRGERAQLVDHRVDGFLELQDLAADVDRDLAGQVAAGDRDGDLGDVAHLTGQVAGHRVHRVGEVFPDARHVADLGLAAQLAVGADLARDAGHLGGEHAELLDHRVDDGRRAEELPFERPALDVEADGLEQVALGDGFERPGDLGRGQQQGRDQRVYRRFHA